METTNNDSTHEAAASDNNSTGNSKNPEFAFSDKTMVCALCNLKEKYDYEGTNPPFSKHKVYKEKCYIKKDPFSLPNKGQDLVIGVVCSVCHRTICSNCSVFFGKRLCRECSLHKMKLMPKCPPQRF